MGRRFQLQPNNCKGLQVVEPKPSRDMLTRIETNCKETQIALPGEERRNKIPAETSGKQTRE